MNRAAPATTPAGPALRARTTWTVPPAAIRAPTWTAGPTLLARTAWAAAALVALAACTGDLAGPGGRTPARIDLAAPWATASIEAVGGSPDLVAEGIERARLNHRLQSLLVVKDGRLAVEEYFGVGHPDSLADVRSVTKSVVSALAGVALERGEIVSLDDPVAGYLAPAVGEIGPAKREITFRHLLTMTSGFEWDESGGFGSYSEWMRSDDHLRFLLDRPLAHPPGARFTYNSAAVHLLGVAVEHATGMRLPELAQDALFGPTGIAFGRWEPLPGGHHNGGAGLDLRPRDLARFGQLYLQGGASLDRQILPREWVDLSFRPHFQWRSDFGALAGISYGLLWWSVPEAQEPLHFAWGYGGQYVFVVPRLDLVVVATNDWRGVGRDGGAERYERETVRVVVDYLVPAFR